MAGISRRSLQVWDKHNGHENRVWDLEDRFVKRLSSDRRPGTSHFLAGEHF